MSDNIGTWQSDDESLWWNCGCKDRGPTVHSNQQESCEFCGFQRPESMTIRARLTRLEAQVKTLREMVTRKPSDFDVHRLGRRATS